MLLIIENDVQLAKILKRQLEKRFGKVFLAHTLLEAKALCNSENITHVLCDVVLTCESGLDFYHWLIETHASLARKLVFMSGGCPPDLEVKIESLPIPLVRKPFSIHQVYQEFQFLDSLCSITGILGTVSVT